MSQDSRAQSPDLFASPSKRMKHVDATEVDDGCFRVNVGHTLVLYSGHILTADYCGIPSIIAGTSLCKISRNIAAGKFAYIFIQIDKSDKFAVLTNGPDTDHLIFRPIS